MTDQEKQNDPFEVISADPAVTNLVEKGIDQVIKGKIKLADLFGAIIGEGNPTVPDKKPPVSPSLTEEQKVALKRLPEVFNSVVVTADRKLTLKELQALVEERETIDAILGCLEKRKSEAIREVFSNHLDHLLSEEEQEAARKDRKGHFAVKQEVPVEGTALKVQRSVSGGKPNLTIQHVEALHAEGKIDRKTYLAITKKPDLPRVLDEDGLHKAIQKDPRLFFLLGSVAEPTTPTTTIKVVPDK